MLENEPESQLSTCSKEEGTSTASLYTLLYTYIFCAEIKHKVTQLQTINMEGWGPRQEKKVVSWPPTRGPERCFLRTSTGGTEG